MKFVFCLIIGTLFGVRTHQLLRSLGYFIKRTSISSLLFASFILLLSFWIARMPDLLFWVVAFLLHLGPGLFFRGIQRRRRLQFLNETSRFYDRFLLGVRSGQSPREILRKVAVDKDFGFHTRDLAEACLREDIQQIEHLRPDFQRRVDEIRRILTGGHRAKERIFSLRRKYRLLERFQRKSRLATQPVRAQIVIVLVLYIGLLGVQFAAEPKILRSVWFFASFFLIFAGVAVVFFLKRSFKWKI